MLVAAVTKVNGYFYAPDPEIFWKQGYSQDNSFIYVTTQYLTAAMLDSLAKEVDAFESLLICAPAFDVGLNKRYDNITVKKIPQSVLAKCEYGVDNYNLNIVEVPECDEEEWEHSFHTVSSPLPILYRIQKKSVVCDSFQGIKNRQPHIRLPAIAIIVTAINQNV